MTVSSFCDIAGGSPRQVVCGGEHDDGAAQLDGDLHLLARARPVRQQHPRSRLLRGARPRLQLSQIRQPGLATHKIMTLSCVEIRLPAPNTVPYCD